MSARQRTSGGKKRAFTQRLPRAQSVCQKEAHDMSCVTTDISSKFETKPSRELSVAGTSDLRRGRRAPPSEAQRQQRPGGVRAAPVLIVGFLLPLAHAAPQPRRTADRRRMRPRRGGRRHVARGARRSVELITHLRERSEVRGGEAAVSARRVWRSCVLALQNAGHPVARQNQQEVCTLDETPMRAPVAGARKPSATRFRV